MVFFLLGEGGGKLEIGNRKRVRGGSAKNERKKKKSIIKGRAQQGAI